MPGNNCKYVNVQYLLFTTLILILSYSCNTLKPAETITAPTANGGPDRTVFPLNAPELSTFTELDMRNAKSPTRFEVKAPNVILELVEDLGSAGTRRAEAFAGFLDMTNYKIGGMGTINIDVNKAGEVKIDRTQPGIFSADETADMAIDLATPAVERIGPEPNQNSTEGYPNL
jgi:hypothetical protein